MDDGWGRLRASLDVPVEVGEGVWLAVGQGWVWGEGDGSGSGWRRADRSRRGCRARSRRRRRCHRRSRSAAGTRACSSNHSAAGCGSDSNTR
eukprot:5089216-Prymnesium_polylepis.1